SSKEVAVGVAVGSCAAAATGSARSARKWWGFILGWNEASACRMDVPGPARDNTGNAAAADGLRRCTGGVRTKPESSGQRAFPGRAARNQGRIVAVSGQTQFPPWG